MVHGGAIATAARPRGGAVRWALRTRPSTGSATVDMHVQYLSALDRRRTRIAEGWVVKRGRTTVFCESELIGATSGKLIARSVLTYNVSSHADLTAHAEQVPDGSRWLPWQR